MGLDEEEALEYRTMPKLLCPCGFVHDLSPIPDDGWITIRDRDYEQFQELEVKKAEPGIPTERVDEFIGTVIGLIGSLYTCPDCSRIMWKQPGEEDYRIFVLERS